MIHTDITEQAAPMTPYDMVVHLADALGRCRALTLEESYMLETAIRQQAQGTWRRKGGRQPSPNSQRLRWSDASDELLIRRVATGETAEQIAQAMNRSVSSVRQRIQLLKRMGSMFSNKQPRILSDRRYKQRGGRS